MSFKKKYLKSKPVCKTTFELPIEAAPDATAVHLVGEFNDWQAEATPMVRRKTGVYNVTIDLEKDREYQFRYLIDGETWENDWAADAYTPTAIPGVENSVISA